MELLLKKNVDKLGRIGDIVKVKKGYARNYLLPKGLATNVSPANLKQIEKVIERGIQPTHLDSHQHIHVFNPAKIIITKLAQEYKINKIRWPREILTEFKYNIQFAKRYSKQKLITIQKKPSLTTTDNFFGLLHTGNPSMKTFLSYLNFNGSAEICCHPALESLQKRDKFSLSRAKELKILTHQRFKDEIKQRGIQLISFREL